MDGISAAGSVAGVAAAGVQLSKFLYDLYSTVKASGQEIQNVANNVSLLAMVLEELDVVLSQDELTFRPELQQAAQAIVLRCATIFQDIRKHTGEDQNLRGRNFSEKAAWYFKRERVKPLRVSLESLKSTLNILLHVVQLAKTTNKVEEYPGVKPIGHWYVRKERRGLVCLVIDNRHTVDKLAVLEDEAVQTSSDLIANEQPVTFADIFPLASASASKRGESPERKFVVAFRSRASQNDTNDHNSGVGIARAGPEVQHRRRLGKASSSKEDYDSLNTSLASEEENVQRPAQAIETKSTRTAQAIQGSDSQNSIPERSTSQLILEVIPHRQADAALGSAHHVAGSVLLEAKAEETLDTLMRQWTYIDPKYFSDDDQASTSSTEPSSSVPLQASNDQRPDDKKGTADDRLPGLRPSFRGQNLKVEGRCSPTQDSTEPRKIGSDEKHSKFSGGQKWNTRKKPSVLLSPQKTKDSRPPFNDLECPSVRTPTTPAPPYGFSQPIQCPKCHATPSPELWSPNSSGKGDSDPTGRALEVIERLSELLRHPSLPAGPLDAQNFANGKDAQNKGQAVDGEQATAATVEVEQQSQRHSTINAPVTEPITLKDCLGRNFIFPLQACRAWQDMDNLIRRSFSHIDSLNSRVCKGDYDILSPTGEIILPEVWSSVVKPGWAVELRFWSEPRGEHTKEALSNNNPEPLSAVVSSSPASRNLRSLHSSSIQPTRSRRRSSWFTGRKTGEMVST